MLPILKLFCFIWLYLAFDPTVDFSRLHIGELSISKLDFNTVLCRGAFRKWFSLGELSVSHFRAKGIFSLALNSRILHWWILHWTFGRHFLIVSFVMGSVELREDHNWHFCKINHVQIQNYFDRLLYYQTCSIFF